MRHTFSDTASFECIRGQVQIKGSEILKRGSHFFDQRLEETLKPTPVITQAKPSFEPLYLEADGTMIHLQRQSKKKAELKLTIIHKVKEKRYLRGTLDAKKLKEKIVYTGLTPGDEFMACASIIADYHFHLEEHKLILIGDDGAN